MIAHSVSQMTRVEEFQGEMREDNCLPDSVDKQTHALDPCPFDPGHNLQTNSQNCAAKSWNSEKRLTTLGPSLCSVHTGKFLKYKKCTLGSRDALSITVGERMFSYLDLPLHGKIYCLWRPLGHPSQINRKHTSK